MSDTPKHTQSFPFFGILALIFITLKLTGHITWSWWWVLSPIWVPFIIAIFIIGISVVIAGVIHFFFD